MLRIGVAGIGHMGKMHLFNLSKIKEVNLVGVADKSRKNQALARQYGVTHVYSDYKELFEEETLDAAIISLPNFLHLDSVLSASEKGINVMIDKPLARSVMEGKRMIEAVNRNKTRLMVNTNFRYFPHVSELKKSVDEGIIGDVVLATIEHIMNGPWSHPLYPRYVSDWWFDNESVGGGALIDNGYHTLDLFTWMFGDCDIEAVRLGFKYNLGIEDSAVLVVKSRSGTRGVINCGWFSNVLFPRLDFRLIAHGTMGFLNTDEIKPSSFYTHAAKEALLNLGRRLIGKPLNLLSYTYYYTSYVKVLKIFLRCLMTGTDFPISLQQQLKVIRSIETAYQMFKNEKSSREEGIPHHVYSV